MGLCSIDGVFGQSSFAPRVGTAYAMNVEVDVEVNKTTASNVDWMTRIDKVFLTIIPSADAKGLISVDVKRTAIICDIKPADVASVAIVLRMNIFSLEVVERHFINTEEGRVIAVGIVFLRASSIITYLREVGRQTHSHTEFGHNRKIIGLWKIFHFDMDATIA